MNGSARFSLPALLIAAALTLASCGGSGTDGVRQGDSRTGPAADRTEETTGVMAGTNETTGSMPGMDHGSMDHGPMMSPERMVMVDGRYSDEAFIDAMVPHHRGAIEMAEVALDKAEHREMRRLAEEIVVAQGGEIEELRRIKRREFGTSEVPTEMSDAQMEAMGMEPTGELANAEPFDKAFIDAMIPHHRSAIRMANVAYRESDNEEIRALASDIVDAQTREIRQMKDWRHQWYPEG